MGGTKIAILGAGSWGTAMAIHLARADNKIMLWTRKPQHAQEMAAQRCNHRYLEGIPFSANISATSSLSESISWGELIIVAVPSHAFAETISQISAPPVAGIAWLTKGLDPTTNQLLHHLVASYWGYDYPVAVISGPSFARELAQDLPTAVTLAGNNADFQKTMRSCLHHHNLRTYLSSDLIGVQLAGAVKNVLAIACGISDGLNYGANAKAALITRGLSEMRRLGKALGARDESFMGLAGVGDLVLTCTDNQSRNRRFGLLVGKGMDTSAAEKSIGQVVEGKNNAAQICLLAQHAKVEMPICIQVNALLNNQITAQQAVTNLMSRSARDEE